MSVKILQPPKERLKYCKSIIKEGQAVFFIVGVALAEIKESRLYELDGCKTFADFCAKEFQWTKRYCDRLIVDADVMRMLPEPMQKLVSNEAAAMALGKIPKLLRPAVADAASGGGKNKITAASVKAAAPKSAPPAKKPAPPAPAKKPGPKPASEANRDGTGALIPEAILPLWRRGVEALELMTYMKAVRVKLGKVQELKDPLYRAVNLTSAIADISQAMSHVEQAIPFAVCPGCQGKVTEHCGTCGQTGIVSEFFWKTCVPEEDKAMRAKLTEV